MFHVKPLNVDNGYNNHRRFANAFLSGDLCPYSPRILHRIREKARLGVFCFTARKIIDFIDFTNQLAQCHRIERVNHFVNDCGSKIANLNQ